MSFTFQQMRTALPVRSQSRTAVVSSLPVFSGLHSTTSRPTCLSTGGAGMLMQGNSIQTRWQNITGGSPYCVALVEFLTGSLEQSLGPQNGSKVNMIRHGKRVPKLGRPADQRKALLRSLTTEVIRHGKIKTTEVKAKAVRRHVDKMITLAKRGDLHARRQAHEFIYDKDLVKALFEGATARFGERKGGYCRVQKDLYKRRGDGADMAIIELVD